MMFKALVISTFLLLHPVHVSLTSIDYSTGMDSYKVFVRMYFDDFLLDYKLFGKEAKNEDFSEGNSRGKDYMEEYLREKIKIEVNNKELSGVLSEIKLNENEVSMNLEYKSLQYPRTITVKNMILTDLYSDQANMIIIRIDDFEEGVKLSSEKTEETFKIK